MFRSKRPCNLCYPKHVRFRNIGQVYRMNVVTEITVTYMT